MDSILFSLIILVVVFKLSSKSVDWLLGNNRKKNGINSNPITNKLELQKQIQEPIFPKQSNKGLDFEKYVVSKFSRDYFYLHHWSSDKYVDGIFPLDSLDPDLFYEFRSQYKTSRFAIECKWRAGFKNDYLDWAKYDQIQNYFRFQRNENIPVFVIIGVGGTESSPKELYIIPLNEIERGQVSLHTNFMNRFKRFNTSKMFFFDTNKLTIS